VQEKFPTPHAGKISRNSVEPALPDTAHARIRITQDGLNHFAGAMTRVSLCDAPESLQRAAQGVASMGEFKAWGFEWRTWLTCESDFNPAKSSAR